MLWTVLAVVLILWLLGGFVFNVGAFIHLLLVIALVAIAVQLLNGRRVD